MADTNTAREPYLTQCIEDCLSCYQTCTDMAMNHCLRLGGKHVAPGHFKAMQTCAEACRTAAHLMIMDSALQGPMCWLCVDACTACAESCAEVGQMEDCVAACRACAESCRGMAG